MNRVLFFLLFIIFSCTQKKGEGSRPAGKSRIVEAKGTVVPKDSTTAPKVKPVKENNPEDIPAGHPSPHFTNNNVFRAKMPEPVIAGTPRICTPGRDSFAMPEIIPAKDSPYAAGIPQTMIAKDASSKDQNSQNFSSFGKLQGLKKTGVSCLLQDRSGNIWLGNSGGGVTKYDGKNFMPFTEKEGLYIRVSCLLEDRSGNIWLAGNGVTKYDGKNFTFYGGDEGFAYNDVSSIAEDGSGNIWFGTNGDGAIKYNGKSFTYFTDKQGLVDSFVHCILKDRSGNMWFGTGVKGVSKYDGKSFTNFTEKEGLPKDGVVSMMEDRSGNIWLGTAGSGVVKYDGKTFINFTDKEGLSHNDVRSITEDRSGNIWFGTNGGGISKFDGVNFTHYTENDGLTSNTIDCILEDKYGNLWIATTSGGLCKYGGKLFTHFTAKEGIDVGDGVYSVLEDRSGNMWFGTAGNGVSKYDGKSFINYTAKEGLADDILCMKEDRSGNIWFGTSKGFVKYDGKIFTHFTDKDGMFNAFVFGIEEDRSGNMWFGTAGGGVSKFDGKSFTKYTPDQGMPDNFIRSILKDRSGNLWFGTRGGVSRYDGKTFINFTEKEGLPDNDVWSVLADRSGNIWIGSEGGLSKLTKNKQALFVEKARTNQVDEGDVFFKNYSYEDGFLGIGVTGALYEDSKGTIWVGANDRLTAYHPSSEADIPDTSALDVQVTNIQLFNENIPWVNLLATPAVSPGRAHTKDTSFLLSNGVKIRKFRFDGLTNWYNLPQHLSLAYNNNFLKFNFIGVTMNQSRNVKYQYKLDGIDDQWSGITGSTEAPYGNLSPGTYTFRVKAMNSEGYWSKEFTYNFTIRPPWWKTWWAYGFYFLAITGSIGYYIKWRERALKHRQQVLEKTVKERTAEVVAGKKLSDDLLLNILPSEVAEELKQKGSAAAKQFDEVTVMFTDFKNFTQITEKLSPTELVAEIHRCFKAFDDIISRYNIEKIKTIGDSYMCAGGLPVVNKSNAREVVSAAIEIQQYIQEYFQERIKQGKEPFEIRIGIHTGQVVAGIVGVKKFAYDIWGDTVNIASRMESSGEAGKVNISGSTYELVKDKFNCIYRGKIQAKNKGEIDMYFVESISE